MAKLEFDKDRVVISVVPYKRIHDQIFLLPAGEIVLALGWFYLSTQSVMSCDAIHEIRKYARVHVLALGLAVIGCGQTIIFDAVRPDSGKEGEVRTLAPLPFPVYFGNRVGSGLIVDSLARQLDTTHFTARYKVTRGGETTTTFYPGIGGTLGRESKSGWWYRRIEDSLYPTLEEAKTDLFILLTEVSGGPSNLEVHGLRIRH